MGRLGGYLKNTKQPAPWENKVQAALLSRISESDIFSLKQFCPMQKSDTRTAKSKWLRLPPCYNNLYIS